VVTGTTAEVVAELRDWLNGEPGTTDFGYLTDLQDLLWTVLAWWGSK
jgi:hypothetical protein